jgi:hypothetical protein
LNVPDASLNVSAQSDELRRQVIDPLMDMHELLQVGEVREREELGDRKREYSRDVRGMGHSA